MPAHVPKWVVSERYAIQARGEGKATKDQMRPTMQALLAERFQLAVDFETRPTAVLAMSLAKPGRHGAQASASCRRSAGAHRLSCFSWQM